MNFLQNINKKIVVFVFLVVLVGIILIVNGIVQEKISKSIPTRINFPNTVSPTPPPTQEINPSYKKGALIPTYTPDKGSGVDLEAPQVAGSMKEIQKIYPFLPYEITLKTPTNQDVSITIPDKTSQTNPWTLQVYVFGLDYSLVKGDQEYVTTKNSFINATSSVYKWIQEKGVDPKKMMIIWGDNESIQNKSQEWLE